MPGSPFFGDESAADAGTAALLLKQKFPGMFATAPPPTANNPFFSLTAPTAPANAPANSAPPDVGQSPSPVSALPWMRQSQPQRPPIATPTGQIAPGASKGQALMVLLKNGLQGAMAGRAANEQAVVQSGGRRSGGVGMGFEAGLEQPLIQASQRQQFQAGQIQNQQTQMQLAQTQALNSAYQAGTAKDPQTGAVSFDRNKVMQTLASNGQGALIPGLTQSFTAMDKSLGDVQKQRDEHAAAADDYVGAALQAIVQSKNPQTGQYDPSTAGAVLAHLSQAYPQEAEQLRGAIAANPARLNQIVDGAIAQSPSQTKIATEATAANARKSQADTDAGRLRAQQDPNSPLYAPTATYITKRAAAGDPDAQAILNQQAKQAGVVAGQQEAAKQPYQMQLEQVRQQVSQQLQTNKDARDKIETSVLKPFEDKMSAVTELQSAIQQAQQGNVTAARGVLLKLIGVSNPDGTKRFNAAEADRLVAQGGIPQQVAGTIKNLLTGDNWTDKMSSDMLSFAGAQADVARGNLNRGIGNVNRLYSTNVGQGLLQGGGSGGQVQVTDPRGGVHTFPDQDSADKFKKLAGIK